MTTKNPKTAYNQDAKGKNVSNTNRVSEVVDFGANDSKGRALGVEVVRYNAEFAPVAADATGWHCIEPGNYYAAVVTTTRDGVRFGALQANAMFASAVDRETYIANRIANARKRYAKA